MATHPAPTAAMDKLSQDQNYVKELINPIVLRVNHYSIGRNKGSGQEKLSHYTNTTDMNN